MKNIYTAFFSLMILLFSLDACKSSIKERSDTIYSRHLQRHVPLTIISGPMPNDKQEMNLLLFIHAQDLEKMQVKKIIDSIFKEKLVEPFMLVGIQGNDPEDYGMAGLDATGNAGRNADKYNEFVMDELYPFIKKKAGVRKFKSIAICGNSLKGVAALDIAWNNSDKISKAGIFSGAFDYAGAFDSANDSLNPVLQKIKSSRKRPKLEYWMYAAENKNNTVFKNTQQLIGIIDKKNTGTTGDIQFVSGKNGNNDIDSWRSNFPAFLIWAFGK